MEAADNPRKPVVDLDENGERGEQTDTLPITPNLIRAQAFRTKEKDQLSYSQLTKIIVSGDESDYRLIPNPDFDNDSNVVAMKDLGNNSCGIDDSFTTVNARLKDCESKFGAETATWSGKANGISGEGDFKLVQKNGNDLTWLDETTGLLWSTPLKAVRWDEASGAAVNADSDQFICNNISSFKNDEVKWRLPTRSDFLQADINGARFVLPKTNYIFWTATSVNDGNEAWAINQATGSISSRSKDDNILIRCVGHVIK